MKQLSLEQIQQYRKKYAFLEKCSFIEWNELQDAVKLIQLKLGYLALRSFLKELDMECEDVELPVHGYDEDGEIDIDNFDSTMEYEEVLSSLSSCIYSQCGWDVNSVEVYGILTSYLQQKVEGYKDIDDFRSQITQIEEEDIRLLWEKDLKSYFEELAFISDFDFVAKPIYDSVSMMLEGSYLIFELSYYSNTMLGRYKQNTKNCRPINVALAEEISVLSREVMFPNALEIPTLCNRGLNKQGAYTIVQSSFYDESTGETVSAISLSMQAMFSSILLNQALNLMNMQQPELFYSNSKVEEKGVAHGHA